MEVEEYLVKFKNFSYLHCQWLTEEELLKGDKRVSNKVFFWILVRLRVFSMIGYNSGGHVSFAHNVGNAWKKQMW